MQVMICQVLSNRVLEMGRYINRNQVTVSQEFTVIELAISAGIIALAMKLLKSNEKKVEQVKPKLEVNLIPNTKNENPWHCWACDSKGKTIKSFLI